MRGQGHLILIFLSRSSGWTLGMDSVVQDLRESLGLSCLTVGEHWNFLEINSSVSHNLWQTLCFIKQDGAESMHYLWSSNSHISEACSLHHTKRTKTLQGPLFLGYNHDTCVCQSGDHREGQIPAGHDFMELGHGTNTQIHRKT